MTSDFDRRLSTSRTMRETITVQLLLENFLSRCTPDSFGARQVPVADDRRIMWSTWATFRGIHSGKLSWKVEDYGKSTKYTWFT